MNGFGQAMRKALRSRGRRKNPSPARHHPGALTKHVLSIYTGDFLTEQGRHVSSRLPAILKYLVYACAATAGSLWIFFHPGPHNYFILGSPFLGASALIAFVAALSIFLTTVGHPQLIRGLIRWGRRLDLFFSIAMTSLAFATAAVAVSAALYSVHSAGQYDTRLLRIHALVMALLAGWSGFASHLLTTQPLFSVIYGRSRTLIQLLKSASRVMVAVALFASVVALILPGSTTWITISAGLLLTFTGWEIAQWSGVEKALRRFLDCATELQGAAAISQPDLLKPLAALENACSRKAGSRSSVVETEIPMVLRVCLESLEPHEARTYPTYTAMADLQKELGALDHEELRVEIGRFAARLRQTVLLRVPLVEGDIWAETHA